MSSGWATMQRARLMRRSSGPVKSLRAGTAALLHRDERPAPPELVAQATVKVLGRTEADHLQPSRVRAASQRVAGGDRAAAASAVDAHLGRAAHDRQDDVLLRREHDR